MAEDVCKQSTPVINFIVNLTLLLFVWRQQHFQRHEAASNGTGAVAKELVCGLCYIVSRENAADLARAVRAGLEKAGVEIRRLKD